MLGQIEAEPAGHRRQPALQRVIAELLDPAAVVADDVVVMLAVGLSCLEARDAVTQVDAVDELQLAELVESAVDARDADPTSIGT